MSESNTNSTPATFGDALFDVVRQAMREVIRELKGELDGNAKLLTPEELAEHLKVPLTWVYEQSRQGNIPTHRLGRYIRFNLAEVLASQKKD